MINTEEEHHYVALLWNPATRSVETRCSPSLAQYADDLLHEAVPRMSHHVTQVLECRASRGVEKKRERNVASELLHSAETSTSISDEQEEHQQDIESRRVCYRTAAQHEWKLWFRHAFFAVQQKGCALVAKEWIKTIHPRKQQEQPYNGKHPATGEYIGPAALRPAYWPSNVVHKEPDRISKAARVDLLTHLITHTPYSQISTSTFQVITARSLQESLDTKRSDPRCRHLYHKFLIIDEIVGVRNVLEQYEMGLIAPDFLIIATDYETVHGDKRETTSPDTELPTGALMSMPPFLSANDAGQGTQPATAAFAESRVRGDSMIQDIPADLMQDQMHDQFCMEHYAGEAATCVTERIPGASRFDDSLENAATMSDQYQIPTVPTATLGLTHPPNVLGLSLDYLDNDYLRYWQCISASNV